MSSKKIIVNAHNVTNLGPQTKNDDPTNIFPHMFPSLNNPAKKTPLTVNSKQTSRKTPTKVLPNNIHLANKPNLNVNSNKTVVVKPEKCPIEELPFTRIP